METPNRSGKTFRGCAIEPASYRMALAGFYPKRHPHEVYNMLRVAMNQAVKKFDGVIPIKRLIIDSCRSSGPGGQHVNKKNTKVSVSFHLETADWLPEDTRNKLAQIHQSKLSKDGFITIRSDKTRTQTLNMADCMDKLRCYISEAEQPPEPELSLETIELRRQQLERASAERLREKRMKSVIRNIQSADNW